MIPSKFWFDAAARALIREILLSREDGGMLAECLARYLFREGLRIGVLKVTKIVRVEYDFDGVRIVLACGHTTRVPYGGVVALNKMPDAARKWFCKDCAERVRHETRDDDL